MNWFLLCLTDSKISLVFYFLFCNAWQIFPNSNSLFPYQKTWTGLFTLLTTRLRKECLTVSHLGHSRYCKFCSFSWTWTSAMQTVLGETILNQQPPGDSRSIAQRVGEKAGGLLDSLCKSLRQPGTINNLFIVEETRVHPSRPMVYEVTPNHTLAKTGLWCRSRI